jgi:hypothetical protein
LKKLVITLTLTFVPFGLAACGGNENGEDRVNDEAQIRAVIDLGNSKNPEVCDRLTDKWMKNVVGGDNADCEQQVKQSPKDAVEIEEISVEGGKATVTAQIQGDPGQLLLVKDNGEWKLDDIRQRTS